MTDRGALNALLIGHPLQRLLLAFGQYFGRRYRSPPSSRRITAEGSLRDSDHVGKDGVTGVATRGSTRPKFIHAKSSSNTSCRPHNPFNRRVVAMHKIATPTNRNILHPHSLAQIA